MLVVSLDRISREKKRNRRERQREDWNHEKVVDHNRDDAPGNEQYERRRAGECELIGFSDRCERVTCMQEHFRDSARFFLVFGNKKDRYL